IRDPLVTGVQTCALPILNVRTLICRAAVLLSSLLAGCYTYAPLATGPAPEMQLSLVLSDVGRVGASATLGSGLDRVDGVLMGTKIGSASCRERGCVALAA